MISVPPIATPMLPFCYACRATTLAKLARPATTALLARPAWLLIIEFTLIILAAVLRGTIRQELALALAVM